MAALIRLAFQRSYCFATYRRSSVDVRKKLKIQSLYQIYKPHVAPLYTHSLHLADKTNRQQIAVESVESKLKRKLNDDKCSEVVLVTRYIHELQQMPTILSQSSARLLMSAVSSALYSSSHTRQPLYDEAWKLILLSGCTLTTPLYNSTIKARLETDQHINPTQELQDMVEKYGVQPNRVTYDLLLEVYARKGDIQGVQDMIACMNAEEMHRTAASYNSLIKAHLVNKDVDAAMAVLTEMRESNGDITDKTYQQLLNYYASTGDTEAIHNMKTTAVSEDNIDFPDNQHYLDMIYHASVAQHSSLVDKLLSEMPSSSHEPHIQDVLNTSCRLVSAQCLQDSCKLFRLVASHRQDFEYYLTKYVNAMVVNEVPLADVKHMIETIPAVSDQINFGLVVHSAFTECQPSYIADVLQYAQEHGTNYRCVDELFFPIQRLHRDKEDVLAYLSVVLPHIADNKRLSAINRYVQLELHRGVTMDEVCDKIKSLPCSSSMVSNVRLMHLVAEGQFSEAAKYAGTTDESILWELPSATLKSVAENRHWKDAAQMLAALPPSKTKDLVCCRVYAGASKDADIAEKQCLYELYTQYNLNMFPRSDKPLTQIQLHEVKKLFFNYVHNGPADKVDELWGILESAGVTATDLNLMRHRIMAEAKIKNNPDNALEMLEQQLRGEVTSSTMHITLVLTALDLCEMFITNKDVTRAEECINKIDVDNINLKDHKLLQDKQSLELQPRITVLLKAALQHTDMDSVIALLKVLHHQQLIATTAQLNHHLLAVYNLLCEHYTTDDIVSYYKACLSSLSLVPFTQALIYRLLESNEKVLLQQVLDLTMERTNYTVAMNRFVIACLEAGKIQQARRIIQYEPGTTLRAKVALIAREANRLRSLGKTDVLQNMITTMKEMKGIKLDVILEQLMGAYYDNKQWRKVQDVLCTYEELQLLPPPDFVTRLYDMMVQDGVRPTFARPGSEQYEHALKHVVPANEYERIFMHKVITEREKPVTEYFAEHHKNMGDDFLATIAQGLQFQQIKRCKNLLLDMDNAGRLDTLLESGVLDTAMTDFITTHRLVTTSDNLAGLQQMIISTPSKLRSITTMHLVKLYEFDPEGFNAISQTMKTQLKRGTFTELEQRKILSFLVSHAVYTNKNKEARQLIEEHKAFFKSHTPANDTIIKQARRQSKMEVLMNLLDLCRNREVKGSITLYSNIMYLHCEAGDYDSAIETYELAVSDGLDVSEVWLIPIRLIQRHLRATGKAAPWEAHMYPKHKQATQATKTPTNMTHQRRSWTS